MLILSIALGLRTAFQVQGQTLSLPPRPTNAPNGTQFTNIITTLSRDERENWIYAQVISGNVPGWMRTLKPINSAISGHTATYHVTPDYLAVGSDTDYFLEPMTPPLAQRLADRLGCSLPTRKIVNQIWTNATVKLNPQPIAPSAEMTTVPVFADHNTMVRTQRNTFTNAQPPGAIVSGDKKDVVISNEITNRPPPPRVVIYGWHYTDGSVIQPLSAAHEETYADYSHGIRFVQSGLIADGAPNTVSNVLASATLSALLSDEGVIPLPRYTVAPLAPVVMTHPRSRSVLPGESVSFDALAIGDAPLSYRWLLNGSTLAGATNATHTVTNIQSSNADIYAIIVTNQTGSVTSRVAVLRVKTTDFPALFADDFNTNTSTNWSLFWGATNGIPDYTADFAFDYAATPYLFNGVTTLIPPAPNSPDASTRALKLTVNADATAATAAVNLYPKNFSASGNLALKFDLWINYPGNAGGLVSTGSTQFAQSGINHSGTNVNWAAPSATMSDGLWFAVDGEGGTSADYRAYRGNTNGTQTDLSGNASTSGLIATNNTAAVFQALFPSTRFETAGSPGKNWIEVELRQFNNTITWLMDGTIIAQRTNTSTFTNGNIMLGLMDTFSSIANPARDSFALFDNVRVENLAPPIQFQTISRQPDGSIALTLASALGDSFWLDSSTNLSNWQSLANITITSTPFTFVETNATRAATYYRARR